MTEAMWWWLLIAGVLGPWVLRVVVQIVVDVRANARIAEWQRKNNVGRRSE